MVWARTACHFVHQLHHAIRASRHQRSWEAKEDVVRMCEKWYDYMHMQPGWCQPVRQEFMENECEALPGVAYPGVRDNCSAIPKPDMMIWWIPHPGRYYFWCVYFFVTNYNAWKSLQVSSWNIQYRWVVDLKFRDILGQNTLKMP